MTPRCSPRLAAIVDALPLRPGMRVLEIGGAPGAAAKVVCERIAPGGHILVIDRSAKGISLIERNAAAEIEAGLLSVRHTAAEEFALRQGEPLFDLAFAVRVGAFDGRYPEAGVRARDRVRQALVEGGRFFVDGLPE
ncbi:SAM-dependent methyltransferase [Amycolatopsis jejuensis]|uniref:SAM-dependent methyltransferase n=1 Tax=Amycolatopsis jejuensis TaxID=330084 RepID=UPI0005270EB2|nr:SAM-dependent methyltransferase [Amycolatopsis jejuensis]